MTATDSSNNNNALTSILQMCKECDSSNISMIRTLVLRALTSPDIFAGFDEIKTAVQPALASAAPDILRTLDLFSYGTYKDVSAGGFLSLTDAQLQKLRMLTVVTLVERACCEQQNGIVPYSTVAQELSLAADTLESNRQVEEIIIACIYAGIVRGKLCQKTRSLVVSSQNGPPCAPRDVQQVSSMLKSLKELQANLLSTIMTMEADKHNVEKRREAHAEFVKRAKEASAGRNTRAAAGGGGNNSRGREMDIRMRRQKRSRGAGGPMAAGGGDGFPRM